MNHNEIVELEFLNKLQAMCNEIQEREDIDVSMEDIWQACSDKIKDLKYSIGDRLIFEYRNKQTK